MSAQSITQINLQHTQKYLDKYLMLVGFDFLRETDYDIQSETDFKKLDVVIWLTQILPNCSRESDVLSLLTKKIKK